MIRDIFNFIVGLLKGPHKESATELVDSSLKLADRLDAQLDKAEVKLEKSRRDLEACLKQRRDDTQHLIELEKKLNRLEQDDAAH